jgi:hypothetical protein
MSLRYVSPKEFGLSQDIYQNRGFERSASILQVASKIPLPAATASLKHVLAVSGETALVRLLTG